MMVGGRGFGPDGRWAHRLGVPWAADASAAVRMVADERLLRIFTVDRPGGPGGEEYAGLTASRAGLVESALADLRERVPLVRDYTPTRVDVTIADLGYIVDVLAAALYVDDDPLFTEFVEWLAHILAGQGRATSGGGSHPRSLCAGVAGLSADVWRQVGKRSARTGRRVDRQGRRRL